MSLKPKVSVIVPTLNESDNVVELSSRLISRLKKCTSSYEIIFIDDNSTDSTWHTLEKLSKNNAIYVFRKIGEKGKGYSILEGIKYARYDVVAMIDADLQYPPEALDEMIKKIIPKKVGMVIAKRHDNNAGLIRRIGTPIMNVMFKVLFGLGVDVQSGLKVFNKHIVENINTMDIGPWTVDLALVQSTREMKYKIESVDIQFEERRSGNSKIHFLRDGIAIVWNALKMRFKTFPKQLGNILKFTWVKQMLYFIAIGFLNTAVDLVLYFSLTRLFGFFAAHIVLTKALTYGVAALNSFVLNRRYTFKGSKTTLYAVIPYVIVSGLGAGINSLVLSIMLHRLDVAEPIALVMATFFAFAWNFTVSKAVVFKPRHKKSLGSELEPIHQLD